MGNRKEHDEKTVREATSLNIRDCAEEGGGMGSKLAKTLLTFVSYLFIFLKQL